MPNRSVARAFAPGASRHRPARPSRPGAWARPHPESHFSAVLDHHYPQV